VDYGPVIEWKRALHARAGGRFHDHGAPALRAEFQAWCASHAHWLEDYALFMALKDAQGGAPWESWPAPLRTSGGDALPAISGYHIYRGEIDAESADAAAKDIAQAKWKAPLQQLASSDSNSYRDAAFDFGKIYVYVVRSLISVEGSLLVSSDSAPAIVAARDTFPPAPPQDLVTVLLPGEEHGTSQVELTWSISLETDLAGYRVYKSEGQTTRGQLLTLELLPTPAYRDTSVVLGHRYWYSVTAVDRAGNESTPSAPAAVDFTQPSS
jgi:hypothetical protein